MRPLLLATIERFVETWDWPPCWWTRSLLAAFLIGLMLIAWAAISWVQP